MPKRTGPTFTKADVEKKNVHHQMAKEIAKHNQNMKSESDYVEGAHDEIGEDARRSREEAKQFQKIRSK